MIHLITQSCQVADYTVLSGGTKKDLHCSHVCDKVVRETK